MARLGVLKENRNNTDEDMSCSGPRKRRLILGFQASAPSRAENKFQTSGHKDFRKNLTLSLTSK
jgi:hypothetical protein